MAKKKQNWFEKFDAKVGSARGKISSFRKGVKKAEKSNTAALLADFGAGINMASARAYGTSKKRKKGVMHDMFDLGF